MIGKKNLKPLLSCLGAAVLFWLVNSLNQEHTAYLDYPLRIIPHEREKIVTELLLPREVRLEVTGSGWSLMRYNIPIGIKPIEIKLRRGKKVVKDEQLFKTASEQLRKLKVRKVVTSSAYLSAPDDD